MPIIAKSSGEGSFELAPTGNQQAVCVFVEDIGTHEGNYQGKITRRRQVVICWELDEKMTEGDNAGKPFMLSKFYTLSLSEKSNLRHDLQSWRGKAFTEEELSGFDLENLKGANCLLNVIPYNKIDGSEGRKIGAISPLIKNMQKIFPINTIPPEWISKKRSESLDFQENTSSDYVPPPTDDDLPF